MKDIVPCYASRSLYYLSTVRQGLNALKDKFLIPSRYFNSNVLDGETPKPVKSQFYTGE